MKRMKVLDDGVTFASSIQSQNVPDLDALADAIANDLKK